MSTSPTTIANIKPALAKPYMPICGDDYPLTDKQKRLMALAHDLAFDLRYSREFVPLINDPDLAAAVTTAARPISAHVNGHAPAITASEDFARFLDHVPGCFAFIGNGETSPLLHAPDYDFNDDLLPIGVTFWAQLVRDRLPVTKREGL